MKNLFLLIALFLGGGLALSAQSEGDQDVIFQPDTQSFLADVDTGLAGEYHTCLYGVITVGKVMYV